MTSAPRCAIRVLFLLIFSALTASAIDSLVPDCTNEGDPGFTLTILGEELEDDDNIRWNNTRLETTFVSSTELRAEVPASLLRDAGEARITLECCPGEGFLAFTIHPDSPGPLVEDDNVTINRDVNVDIHVLRNDRDTDGTIDPETLSVARPPASGAVAVNSDGTITYDPEEDFSGTDSFTYTVKDQVCAISEPATVTVNVLDEPGVSCAISPRNAYYPFHRPDELLLLPIDAHVLAVTVTAGGEPAASVQVSLSADRNVFPGDSGLAESDMSILETDGGGEAEFEVNPVSPEESRKTLITATGTADGMPFSCRASILTGGGSLTAPFQAVPDMSKAVELFVEIEREIAARADPFEMVADHKRLSREVAQMVVEEVRAEGVSRLVEMAERFSQHDASLDRILGESTTAYSEDFVEDTRALLGLLRERGGPHLSALASHAEVAIGDAAEYTRPSSTEAERANAHSSHLRDKLRALGDRGRKLAGSFGPLADYGRLPLAFEANQGQASADIRYLSRGPGSSLYLKDHEAVLVGDARDEAGKRRADILRMRLVDANPSPAITPVEPLRGKSHYLVGRDPAGWTADVSHYRKVKYEGVYPGIDLVYYGNPGSLEYDFIVSPRADPTRITVAFHGMDDLRLNEEGELAIELGAGRFRLKEPVAYQQIAGVRREVDVHYIAGSSRHVQFGVAEYDRTVPLVIDPVLSYSTYLGGANNEVTTGLALDAAGNIYVSGTSSSVNLPVSGGLGRGFSGGAVLMSDAFVTKLDPTGTMVIYSTYIGGSGDDIATAIAVDDRGRAYLTGGTTSTDFPTFRAFQEESAGGSDLLQTDAFAVKLGSTGASFSYSTYLGGSGDESGRGIAADADGQAYIVGATNSSDFPLAAAFEDEAQGGWDAFVTKIESLGTGLAFSTYLGGSANESAQEVRIDATGDVYVVGDTHSADFPTVEPLQEQNGGSADAFVTRFDPTTGDPIWSTYLGGEADDFGAGISVEGDTIHITGATGSRDFPVRNALQPELAGDGGLGLDAFLSNIDKTGKDIIYSTFLGGSEADIGFGVAVDPDGNAWVVGETASADFPAPGAVQLLPGGESDGFVAHINSFGSALEFSTYFGGSGNDGVVSVALDAERSVYFTGPSESIDAPVTVGALQIENLGQSEGLIAKLIEGDSPPAVTTIQAASGALVVAPASIASGFGDPLAPGTEAATEQPLPTELLGVSVRITDSAGTVRLSQLFVVTPAQINFFLGPATALGLALVEVLDNGAVVATGTVQVAAVSPGIFTANADGKGVPAARFLRFRGGEQTAAGLVFDGNAALGEREALQLPFGDADELLYVALFGTGMRAGAQIAAILDGEAVPISAAVPLDTFTGLDQVNIGPIPSSFIGRGIVELVVFVDGVATNTVLLHF